MPTDDGHSPAHAASKGFAFAHFAFIAALFPPLLLVACMMLTHLGYISDDLGFHTLTLRFGPKLASAALAIGALSLLISLFMAPKRCAPWALAAVVISAALLGGFSWYKSTAKACPPISDVATDWDRPLTLSDKLVAARGADAKLVEDLPRVPRNESLEWGGKTIPDINSLTCPGAHPVMRRGISPDQVAEILKGEKYSIFDSSASAVEATSQDNFFGFKYDVVVRLDPGRVDVRSISRYETPDMGINCRHVTDIVRKIEALPVAPDASDAPASEATVASGVPAADAGGDDGGGGD